MKKFLLIFILLFSFAFTSANAQVQYYRTTAYAEAYIYNGRYVWSDWQSSNMTLVINLNTDVITIYSPKIQVYKVYGTANNGNAYTDSSGGVNIKFYVIDQDGDKGEVRLRIESNGNSQVYVDFFNVAFVWNVVRTS